jgi:hypothetical protein
MSNKVIDNGSAGSKLLKYDYPELEVIGVNAASTLEEWFKDLDPEEGKIFLPCNADELRANNEKLRQVIQGLETKGFRNKIVLPYEGMDANEMGKLVKIYRPELKMSIVESQADEETQPVKLPTAKGIDIGEKTKIESIALDTDVQEFKFKGKEVTIDAPRVQVDPDDEMKEQVVDIKEGEVPEPPEPPYYRSYDKDETGKTSKKRKRSF